MFVCIQCGQCHRMVQVIGRGDHDYIERFLRQHHLVIGVHMRDVIFLDERGQPGSGAGADCRDFDPLLPLETGNIACPNSRADYPNS